MYDVPYTLNRRRSLPSELGEFIASARKERGVGLRALAREIRRSPSFLVMIEKNDPPPGVAEETLRRIARALDLNPDHLITLAGKIPDDVVPNDELEVAIYRLVKQLSPEAKRSLRSQLEKQVM